MDLTYSPDEVLLQDSARRFFAAEYDTRKRHKILQSAAGFSPEIWRHFAELGWLALPFNEADGGLGGSATQVALLMEAFGGALVVEPYLPCILLGGALLEKCGDTAQRGMLQPVMEGRLKLALAHGSGAASASRHGQGWRLEGRRTTILGGDAADTLIVSACLGEPADTSPPLGLFIVPVAAAGVDLLRYRSVDGRGFADVTLSGVTLSADALLGRLEEATPALAQVQDNATVALCADALGAMCALVEATVAYAKTRTQFGRPIGQFQALSHRMAEMAVLREEARATLLLAVLKADADAVPRARATSAAKAKLGRAARFIGQQSVQLHGAMGVTEELDIGAYFKRLTSFELLFGNTDDHLRRYAELAMTTDVMSISLLSAG